MRHSAKYRMNARGRPQSLQRFFFRVEYFGSRFALTIIDVFAMATSRSFGERHAHQLEQPLSFFVVLRAS